MRRACAYNIFHAPVQAGFIQGGQGHSQVNTFTNNPKIDEIVRTIIQLTEQSEIHASDTDSLQRDAEIHPLKCCPGFVATVRNRCGSRTVIVHAEIDASRIITRRMIEASAFANTCGAIDLPKSSRPVKRIESCKFNCTLDAMITNEILLTCAN